MFTKIDILKLKSKAAFGNLEAMYELGFIYLYGRGVEPNIGLSHKYFYKSAINGFKPSIDILEGVFANNGESESLSEDFERGYETMHRIVIDADKGNASALFLKSMEKMRTDTDDFRFYRGLKDLQKSAEQNYIPAIFLLGMVYRRDDRIEGKETEGLELIKTAAEKEYIPAIKYMMGITPESMYDILSRMAEKENADGIVYELLSQFYLHGIKVEKGNEKALGLLQKAADKNDVDAIHDLAIIYEFGQFGVKKDIEQAVQYLEKGISLDDAQCMNDLGWMMEQSEDYPHDYNRAFELYKKASEKEHAMAYNNLGTCYKRAIGTEKDGKMALECYEKAFALGETNSSCWNLYLYYMDGVCVPRDYLKAVEWLEKGDNVSIAQCTYQLSKHYMNGDGVERDIEKAFFYTNKAASMGFEEAYCQLADCYRHGIGTPVNKKESFHWYQKAAEVSVEGLAKLGQCYTYAIGTSKDFQKAAELYKIAAEKGSAQAQYDLGICYRHGEGVEQNPSKAIEWYLKAAEQGHGGAMNNLGIMYEHGIGVDVDLEKSIKYFKGAAEAGNADGQCCLAIMYMEGKGVEQNYKEAVKWFKEAANQGEPDSMFHLAICYNEGLGVEIDTRLVAYYLYAAADRGFKPAIDVINKNKLQRPNEDFSTLGSGIDTNKENEASQKNKNNDETALAAKMTLAEKICNAWNNLDFSMLEPYVSERTFEYSSVSVTAHICSKEEYINYLKGKFKSMKSTDIKVSASILHGSNDIFVLIRTDASSALISYDIENNEIISMQMRSPYYLIEVKPEDRNRYFNWVDNIRRYAISLIEQAVTKNNPKEENDDNKVHLNWLLYSDLSAPHFHHISFYYKRVPFCVLIALVENEKENDDLRLLVDGQEYNNLINECEKYKMIPCIMPLNARTGEPIIKGEWPLLRAELLDPIELENFQLDELLGGRSDWELHNIAMNIVLNDLSKNGYSDFSWCDVLGFSPEIRCTKGDKHIAIIVKSTPAGMREERFEINKNQVEGANCDEAYLADVSFANIHNNGDFRDKIIYRGDGYYISYTGLEKLDEAVANHDNIVVVDKKTYQI